MSKVDWKTLTEYRMYPGYRIHRKRNIIDSFQVYEKTELQNHRHNYKCLFETLKQ